MFIVFLLVFLELIELLLLKLLAIKGIFDLLTLFEGVLFKLLTIGFEFFSFLATSFKKGLGLLFFFSIFSVE